jgi:hypothetical protein
MAIAASAPPPVRLSAVLREMVVIVSLSYLSVAAVSTVRADTAQA